MLNPITSFIQSRYRFILLAFVSIFIESNILRSQDVSQVYIERVICENSCIDLFQDDREDYCYSWVNNEGEPLEDQEVSQNICYPNNFNQSRIVIDENGDVIQQVNYDVASVGTSIGQLAIAEMFAKRAFTFNPYFRKAADALTSGGVGFDNRTISCPSFINFAGEIVVDQLSHNVNSVVAQNINLTNILSDIACEKQLQILFTSNNSFCNEDDSFEAMEQLYESIEEPILWVHYASMDFVEDYYFDLMFFKFKDEVGLDVDSEGDISFSRNIWPDAFPQSINPNLPDTEYKITHRSFAPWVDFGSFYYADPNLRSALPPFTTNDFEGDNRSFSLEEHLDVPFSGPGVTSRTYQSVTINPSIDGSLIDNNPRVSDTKGHFAFIQGAAAEILYAPESFINTWREILGLPPGGDVTSTDPCDFDNACLHPGGTSDITGLASFSNSTLYMHSFASNACMPLGLAPLVDMRTKISFTVTQEGERKFLDIKGIILNKGYPAQEAFIEDALGNKVSLYTYGPRSEGAIFVELIENWYDNMEIINFSVEINEEGAFKDLIRKKYPPNSVYEVFNNQAADFFSSSGLTTNKSEVFVNIASSDLPSGSTLFFTFDELTIDQWNNFNLSKQPAGDCVSVPCCGIDGCCGDED